MPVESAGILLYKRDPILKVLLAHPGGPYWQNKDEGAWSIPKGLIEDDEDKLAAAIREFEEEIGFQPDGTFIELGSIKQKGGKIVYSWAVEGYLPKNFQPDSNHFKIEWPPESGRMQQFPEIDRVEFFDLETARIKINTAQRELLARLQKELSSS